MDHMPDVQERPALRPRLCGAAVLAALGAALSGCVSGSVAVLNALEPAGGVAITRDIPYAENAPSGGGRHALDVYAPRNPRPGAPVVVFFYGGGWDSGNKGDYRFVGAALAAHGYLAIVPDYRLYPHVGYPDFLRDCALAVRWAKDHARDYGYDPETLFLMGHSAGAYNAVMLEVDPQWLNAVGLDSRRDIRGVAALAGPYDFLPLKSDTLKRIFGPEETRRPPSRSTTWRAARRPCSWPTIWATRSSM